MNFSQFDNRGVAKMSSGRPELMTPLSATFDGRRDSLASLQSSASLVQSFVSVPSTGSSAYCSPRLPRTPMSGQDPRDDWALINKSMMYDNHSPHEHGRDDLQEYIQVQSPLAHRFNKAPLTQAVPLSHWTGLRHEVNPMKAPVNLNTHGLATPPAPFTPGFHNMLPQHQSSQEALLPAAEVYPANSEWHVPANVTNRPEISSFAYPGYTGPWQESPLAQQYGWNSGVAEQATQGYEGAPFTNSFDSSLSGGIHPAAIFPDSDTMGGAAQPGPGPDMYDDEQGLYSPLSEDSPSTLRPSFRNRDDDAEYIDERTQRRIIRTPTGGKGIKKEKSRSAISKRRTRNKRVDVEYVHSQANPITVKILGDLRDAKMGEDGKWANPMGVAKKKYICEEIIENGETCGKPFKRPEHLKRHIRTHTKETNFTCAILVLRTKDGVRVLEECATEFGRNDNCAAHYKTHVTSDKNGYYFPSMHLTSAQISKMTSDELLELALSMRSTFDGQKKGSRNYRYQWEAFVTKVNELKQPEEAQKLIVSVFKACLKEDEKKRNANGLTGAFVDAGAGMHRSGWGVAHF